MNRKYHNHKPQTAPWHSDEMPRNHHETPGHRPEAKYFEKYSNTLQLLWLNNDYNYITITGPVEMYWLQLQLL